MFRVVTQIVCSRCERTSAGVTGFTPQYSEAITQAMVGGWTKHRGSIPAIYQYHCPGCSADPPMPIMELSTDH